MVGDGIAARSEDGERGASDFSATGRDIDFRGAESSGIPVARMKFVLVTACL